MTRRTLALLAATWKALPGRPLAAGGVLGLILVAIPPAASVRLEAANHADLLRLAALAGAMGAAFVLDDPARDTVAVVPTPRLLRQGLRIALALPFAAGWWTALLLVTWYGMDDDVRRTMPTTGVTIEAMALLTIAVTLGAAAARFGDTGNGGLVAVPGLLLVAIVAKTLPGSVALVLPPGHGRWARAHDIWALTVAGGAVAVVLLAHERAPIGLGRRGDPARR